MYIHTYIHITYIDTYFEGFGDSLQEIVQVGSLTHIHLIQRAIKPVAYKYKRY
jgi:hypothetical protein